MSRLPTVGADTNAWGTVLNDYLSVEHDSSGKHTQQHHNVKAYGAVGDGTTDDTAAIQAAIDAANAAGGGVVFFPVGTYNIYGSVVGGTRREGLVPKNNVSFAGAGARISTLKYDRTDYPVLFVKASDASYLDNARFVNLGFVSTSTQFEFASTTSSALAVHHFRDLEITGCYFDGWTMAAAYVGISGTDESSNLRFHHNYQYGNGLVSGMGVYTTHAKDVSVTHNVFDKVCRPLTGEQSVATDALNGVNFSHNIVRNGAVATSDTPAQGGDGSMSYTGVNLAVASTSTISNVRIVGNLFADANAANTGVSPGTAHDILISGGSAGTLQVSDVVVANNVHSGLVPRTNSDWPVLIQYAQRGAVTGNIYTQPGGVITAPIGLNDAKGFAVGPNQVEGANWTQSLQESATIQLDNLFICPTASSKVPTVPNRATSKSYVWRIAANSSRLTGDTIMFGPNGNDVQVGSTALTTVALGFAGTGYAAGTTTFLSSIASGDSSSRLVVDASGKHDWGPGNAARDTNLYRSAADVLATDDAILLAGTAGKGYIEGTEQSADPAAPPVNGGRLFFKDNGVGKTQLVVRFNTGVTQVVATEP